jgi:hypothetical protein
MRRWGVKRRSRVVLQVRMRGIHGLNPSEGVPSRFFAIRNAYLFIGDYKYWLMTPPDQVDWDDEEVLNRAPLYRDRRDFVIQDGDSGMRIDYPSNPPH